MIPLMMPANGGAPLATAIPKHRGSATKKTTMPGSKSARLNENGDLIKCIFIKKKTKLNQAVVHF
jgi:hypothetical protein